MPRPLDIATNSTVEFVRSNAKPGCSILEIGCGDGDVALALQNLGFSITALDSNESAVANARQKSVRAFQAKWPDYSGDPVDVILFTRSLHHIDDLDSAVGAAREHLCSGGLLMLEDFAFDDADARTCNWFKRKLQEEPFATAMAPPESSFVQRVLDTEIAADAWIKDHGHEIHSISDMTTAIENVFTDCAATPAPYFYRYVIQTLPETETATKVAEAFFHEESAAIDADEIMPIGRRLLARHDG